MALFEVVEFEVEVGVCSVAVELGFFEVIFESCKLVVNIVSDFDDVRRGVGKGLPIDLAGPCSELLEITLDRFKDVECSLSIVIAIEGLPVMS